MAHPRLAFVTGAGDFVGLNLVEALLAQGWAVIALAQPGTRRDLLDQWAARQPALTVLEGDATSLKVLKQALPSNVDAIFHTVHHVSLWSREARAQTKAHVQSTRYLVQLALERQARRFIHTSSIVAYGFHKGTITEETPSSAKSSRVNYVRSKSHAEREVRKGIRLGLPAVILNPANMIGRYDQQGWIRLFRLVERRQAPVMAAGGGSFCHAQAVALAQIQAVDRGQIGANYLLGGADTTYANLLNLIGARLQRRILLSRPLPTQLLLGAARLDEALSGLIGRKPLITREAVELLSAQTYCRSTRAERELGYKPIPLDTMLDDCYRWMQEDGQIGSSKKQKPRK